MKSLPIITMMLFALSMTMEIFYRILFHEDQISLVTSIINWSIFGIFLIMSIIERYIYWTSIFVNPLLQFFSYYYLTYIDFDDLSDGLIYFWYFFFLPFYRVLIAISTAYFILMFFND
jgi:hypothetical protein